MKQEIKDNSIAVAVIATLVAVLAIGASISLHKEDARIKRERHEEKKGRAA